MAGCFLRRLRSAMTEVTAIDRFTRGEPPAAGE
jgi:hypothetical protein